MFRPIFLLLLVSVVTTFANHQNYPGTKTRPVLSDSEASLYTKEKYLNGWTPEKIQHSKADYTVGSGHYTYIQEAVNAAIQHGGTTRKYIHVEKGTYKQVVFIPQTTVPITIYGTYNSPGDVHIVLSQGAKMTGAEWAQQANPGGKVFKEGDPAYSLYHKCASRQAIGTSCSQVVWAQADNVEIAYLTIENTSKDGQAVAIRLDGDKQNVDHANIYGFQDTLYASGKRIYVSASTIKGDVDFIFGSASAVFENDEIIARGDRPRSGGHIFAPNTESSQKYGFLLIKSKVNADGDMKSHKGVTLARAWDNSSSANGQLVIRETDIDDVLNVDAPYATAVGGRAYSGNINKDRNLDDPHYNRFWEYKNNGGGS